jgi:hypothetical protein
VTLGLHFVVLFFHSHRAAHHHAAAAAHATNERPGHDKEHVEEKASLDSWGNELTDCDILVDSSHSFGKDVVANYAGFSSLNTSIVERLVYRLKILGHEIARASFSCFTPS